MEDIRLLIILPMIMQLLFFGITILIFGLAVKMIKSFTKRKIKGVDKNYCYRDIPCNKDIDLAYWLLVKFSDMNVKDLNNGIIGAYILKWYQEGYIDVTVKGSNNYSVDLKDGNWSKTTTEKYIYDFLKDVAGNNNILEKNELKNYCSVGGNQFNYRYLFKRILSNVQDRLVSENKISVIPERNLIFVKFEEQITPSDEIVEEYKNLLGLKNFLVDYSNIDDKKYIEVHLWEEYLIFAHVLGIADKVKGQFKKINPNFNNIVNNMFEINLDNSVTGILDSMYKGMLFRFGTTVVIFVMFILILFGDTFHINFDLSRYYIYTPLVMVLGILIWAVRKNIITRKVKEMNTKTVAVIKSVNVEYRTEYDSETNRSYRVAEYHFSYEFDAKGTRYTGYSISKSRKKAGKKVKIYYNEMKPEKNETAEEHNSLNGLIVMMTIILIALVYVYKGLY